MVNYRNVEMTLDTDTAIILKIFVISTSATAVLICSTIYYKSNIVQPRK